MTIFEFSSYKAYVRARIKAMPKAGRGQMLRLSKLLNVHTSMITHVFRGDANLTIEQALRLGQDFGLNELETEYLIHLVEWERAGTAATRAYYQTKLRRLRHQALDLSKRIEVKKILGEKDQGLFYSAWFYSGIRLAMALPGIHSVEAAAELLNLPRALVQNATRFLLETGLLNEVANGRMEIGESRTYVPRESLLAARHHRNWRLKLIEKLDALKDEELVFTNPITLSEKDFLKIREELVQTIDKFRKIADPSEPQVLCCLNIDWFRL